MHRSFTQLVSIGLLTLLVLPAAAQDPEPREIDPQEVLAYSGELELSQLEIDAAFSKLPESERLRFIRDGGKVDQLIRVLMRRKAIAADAAKAAYDQDPVIAARMQLEAEKELAEAWLQNYMEKMPAVDYEVLAREDFLANPDSYRSPVVLDISHILIGTAERSAEQARSLALSLAAQLREDPSQFDEFVEEHSDDPAKASNGGRYREMRRGMMTAPFEQAAFGLEQPGELSKPVETEYGYHIIRLNARSGNELREFDEVKDEAMARAERKYTETYRENYLSRVQSDPIVVPPEAVEAMAKRHFGENLELAPGVKK